MKHPTTKHLEKKIIVENFHEFHVDSVGYGVVSFPYVKHESKIVVKET